MFDSPFDYCPVCRDFVLIDTTQRQCAQEHACPAKLTCPFGRFFTGMEFRDGQVNGVVARDNCFAPK